MIEYAAKTPTIPIPFHKLLKVVALVDGENPQVRALLERIEAENFEIEISDRYDRDVSEDAEVGAYIASVDGDRRERGAQARASACATSVSARRCGRSRIRAGSPTSSVLGMAGEVDGYIYLGQQTPAFYAKQVIASIVAYGMSLLPPFFGGLMAYDAEAKVSFACPGHQGGEFYRKSPAGQLFFKHFGEQIFRNDLCNADVELGDLLIHVGAAVDAQRHAAQVFGADRTYFVLNGTSTSNKVVTQATLRRGDLVLFDRNNHKSLHQGALVKAGAIPIFLPTARNPFGMIGAVDWDAWDEKYLREQIRANPLVKDKERHKARAAVPARVHPARDLRRHDLQRPQGAREDRPPLRLRAVGRGVDRLQRVPSAVHRPQPDAPRRTSSPRMAGLFSTQSVHKQGAGFSQASQIHKRDEHIRGQRRFIEHKRFNESFLMYCSTSPFYPLFAALDVNAKLHDGQGRRDALGPLHRARHRGAQEAARVRPPLCEDGPQRRGTMVLRSVRARRRHHSRLEAHEGRHERRVGGAADRGLQARAAMLDVRSEGHVARLLRLHGRLRDGGPEQAHAADAGHRSQDRRVSAISACRRPCSRTTCASSASFPRSAISTASCSC